MDHACGCAIIMKSVLCNMRTALYNVKSALSDLGALYNLCILCNMRPLCNMRSAQCNMRSAQCNMWDVLCVI